MVLLVALLSYFYVDNHSAGQVKSVNITSNQGYFWPYEDGVFTNLLNTYRQNNGLGAVSRSSCLTNAARDWSKSMSANNNLVHSNSSFKDSYCGGGVFGGTGEIILWDGSIAAFASTALNTFKNSPPHNSIMLTGSYDYVGVGFFYDHIAQKVWVSAMFGDCNLSCPNAVTSAPNDVLGGNNSKCDSINLNNTNISTGGNFSATIQFRNTGGLTWFGSGHNVISKNPDGNSKWGINTVKLGAGNAAYHINPGMIGWFKATFKAPNVAGASDFSWRIRNSGGTQFGANCSISINVSGATSNNSNITPDSTQASNDSSYTGFYTPPDAEPINEEAKKLLRTIKIKKGEYELNSEQLSQELNVGTHEILTIKGSTDPGGSVKIYIYSDPKTFIVNSDNNGNWSYQIKGLSEGEHHVEVVELDKNGNEITRPSTLMKLNVFGNNQQFNENLYTNSSSNRNDSPQYSDSNS